jgi:hypothetical protein
MNRILRNRVLRNPRFLGTVSILLLLGILIACLRPFHAPRNTAAWVTGGHGIAFGRHGVLLGSDSLTAPGSREAASASLELWLQPDRDRHKGSILALYSAENPRQFSIEQWDTGLALRSNSTGDPLRVGATPSYTHGVFTPGEAVFITITSGEQGTQVYVGGILRRVTPSFRITNRMLSGKLLAGTAAVADYSWAGQLRGLAIYSIVLSPAQVQRHYISWTSNGRPNVSDADGRLALYLFDEGTGNRVRSAVPGGGDLYMPERYFVPAKGVLLRPSLDNWKDIIANIVGFLPFGFTLCGYLISSGRTRLAVGVTAVICGVLSLLVESLQVFLPTRDSSMTDVITNFLGGAIGALLYRWCAQDRASSPALSAAGTNPLSHG